MDQYLKESWGDEDHFDFYENLKTLDKESQANLILKQAMKLTQVADGSDKDMLKAAESLVNFWILNYSDFGSKQQADYLLERIHKDLQ